jgi:hypothetical protein
MQALERGDRLGHQRHVVAVQVRDDAVEVIGDEGAACASRVLLVDPESEALRRAGACSVVPDEQMPVS